ncbi:helix-turn-helix domain-containing protein [Pseudomonas nicosulfuronedens]|uniref:helix-turn-helix domain-containing protein n=1 Tax=Pseudomonas nicosulfuronedens TaxID=2571105 RepID=UPI003133562B
MSTIIMSACWPLQGMSPAQKTVLISLADQANDDGVCWPSVASIAMRTCLSERATQGALKWLEEHGAVERDRRNQRSTLYKVTPGNYTGKSSEICHYVYRIEHMPSGQFYIGLRSVEGDPGQDAYFGSGVACKWLETRRAECQKHVVATFDSRKEASEFESLEIAAAISSPLCLNQRVTSSKADGGARAEEMRKAAERPVDPADDAPRGADAAPAESAPAANAPAPSAPANAAPLGADAAPSTPQMLHLPPADAAPGTVIEPSVEPSGEPPSLLPAPAEPPRRKRQAKPKDEAEEERQAACRAIWSAYSQAYQDRYETAPVRNQKVNTQVDTLRTRLGHEAPAVAEFFVWINDSYLIRHCHNFGLLLANAEGYRTQWATGRQMNGATARQLENTQANINAAQQAAANIRAGGSTNAFLRPNR